MKIMKKTFVVKQQINRINQDMKVLSMKKHKHQPEFRPRAYMMTLLRHRPIDV